VPALALVLLATTWGTKPPAAVLAIAGLFLAGSVLAAVHHAEVIAHRVGEPFGSLVLAVSVTVIEVALIVTLMISGGPETATLARDTVFAAVMITCNGILGISLLVGTLRRGLASFNAEGAATALATVATLATLSLVLPTFTTSAPGPEFSPGQLAFAAAASLVLYALFVFVQAIRHRDFFVPAGVDDQGEHAARPSNRETAVSLAFLLVALVAIVGLAKTESPAIADAIDAIGAPQSAVGVVIALLVLLPETLAAVRNARRGRIQTSFNLAFGSAGQHRPDHPGDRNRLDLARRPPRARPGGHADRAARDHRRRRGAYRPARARDAPGERRAPRALRRLSGARAEPLGLTRPSGASPGCA